jgi:hypothetical protein
MKKNRSMPRATPAAVKSGGAHGRRFFGLLTVGGFALIALGHLASFAQVWDWTEGRFGPDDAYAVSERLNARSSPTIETASNDIAPALLSIHPTWDELKTRVEAKEITEDQRTVIRQAAVAKALATDVASANLAQKMIGQINDDLVCRESDCGDVHFDAHYKVASCQLAREFGGWIADQQKMTPTVFTRFSAYTDQVCSG